MEKFTEQFEEYKGFNFNSLDSPLKHCYGKNGKVKYKNNILFKTTI